MAGFGDPEGTFPAGVYVLRGLCLEERTFTRRWWARGSVADDARAGRVRGRLLEGEDLGGGQGDRLHRPEMSRVRGCSRTKNDKGEIEFRSDQI